MNKLFSTVLVGALAYGAFGMGAVFGQHQTTKQWQAREAETRQVYESGLDTLSDLVNDAYGKDVVEVSQRADGTKLYTIDARKINNRTIKTSRK